MLDYTDLLIYICLDPFFTSNVQKVPEFFMQVGSQTVWDYESYSRFKKIDI